MCLPFDERIFDLRCLITLHELVSVESPGLAFGIECRHKVAVFRDADLLSMTRINSSHDFSKAFSLFLKLGSEFP